MAQEGKKTGKVRGVNREDLMGSALSGGGRNRGLGKALAGGSGHQSGHSKNRKRKRTK